MPKPIPKTHRHLVREYKNREPIAECGAHIQERHGVFKACEVTCPRCKGTSAFKRIANHPFYGIKPLDPWEEKLFRRSRGKRT